jgi:uncharacterized protein YggE
MRFAALSSSLLALFAAAAVTPASAQTPVMRGEPYVSAPWWMRAPVIASTGLVQVDLTANRAYVSASFRAVDRSVAEASRAAADQVRAVSRTLGAYGEDKVRVQTSLTTQPLYDQYRDEDGVLRDNRRADRIERYEAQATVTVFVDDVSLIERIYATLLAARPASLGQVSFSLEPENAWKANLAAEAVKDARRRAQTAAQSAGATLGAVKLIDPTGRACQTDVLVGWPSYGGSDDAAYSVSAEDIVVTGSRVGAPPPPPPPAPPPPPSEAAIDMAQLTLQPPKQRMSDSACVIFELN